MLPERKIGCKLVSAPKWHAFSPLTRDTILLKCGLFDVCRLACIELTL